MNSNDEMKFCASFVRTTVLLWNEKNSCGLTTFQVFVSSMNKIVKCVTTTTTKKRKIS